MTTEPAAQPYLQIKGLVKKFGSTFAVRQINLDIQQHEIFALLGSSGSGKSTLAFWYHNIPQFLEVVKKSNFYKSL